MAGARVNQPNTDTTTAQQALLQVTDPHADPHDTGNYVASRLKELDGADQQLIGQGIGMFGKAAVGAAGYFNTPDSPDLPATTVPQNAGVPFAPDSSPTTQQPYYSPNMPSSGAGSGTYEWNGYMPVYQ